MGTRSHKLLKDQKFSGTLLNNCIEDLGRKYSSSSLVLVSVYTSMISDVLKGEQFF